MGLPKRVMPSSYASVSDVFLGVITFHEQDTDVLHAVVSGDFSYKLCKNAHRDFTLAVVKHSECALQPDSLSCHDKIA